MAVVADGVEYCQAFQSFGVVRSIDEENRTAIFVAATEKKVSQLFFDTVLRMSGARLGRFKKNPVVVDNHNIFGDAGSVVGSASMKVEGRQMVSEVTYATTDRAEEIWTLVRTGFLKAVSIRYIPNPKKTIVLEEGESHGKGANRVEGPARVFMEWELLELSMVPVPADEDTLRRAFDDVDGGGLPSSVRELVLGEVRKALADKESDMSDEKQGTKDVGEVSGGITPPAGTRIEVPGTLETAIERSSDAPPLAEELAARRLSALSESIRAICPSGLESVADVCILEGKTLEESRAVLVAARSELAPSLGTPEPLTAETGEGAADGERSLDDVSDGELASALHF